MNDIDWDKIPKGFDWVATDENGEVWAFTHRPEAELYAWYCKDGKDEIRVCFAGDRKEGNWLESLKHRPPEEPQPGADWKTKYEQLYQEVADFIDYRESYIELREKYLEQADKVRRLAHELEQAQAELNDLYKDREKLNKIVNLLNEA